MLIAAVPPPVSRVRLLPLAEDRARVVPPVTARAAVEVRVGVVTLVEKVGLLIVATVRVLPRETVPPPVMLVPLEMVSDELTRAALATVEAWSWAPLSWPVPLMTEVPLYSKRLL